MKKGYIVLNVIEGWKVVLDGRHVDCTKPLFVSNILDEAKGYCANNNIEVIRVCR